MLTDILQAFVRSKQRFFEIELARFTPTLMWLREEMNGGLLLLVFIPAILIAYAVMRQSKTVAALAQISGLQERDECRTGIVKALIRVDKTWFQLGVANMVLSAYILGGWPELYHLYYTPKVIFLTLLRLYKFRQSKKHYLLWDFCYWGNFACIFYCWFMPWSPTVFQVIFMSANGPMAWSVLAFNHAMIFHSYAHITSAVVHLSPVVLTYGLRWHCLKDQYYTICAGDCGAVSGFELVSNVLIYFYLWWLIIYYLWIFVTLGKYIENRGYHTLWDRILLTKPVGPPLQNMLQKGVPKLIVQGAYLLIHLAFSLFTFSIAVILWHSQLAHFLFMITLILATVKNAADFYFDIFEQHYSDVMQDRQGGEAIMDAHKGSLRKRVVAASPGLGIHPKGC